MLFKKRLSMSPEVTLGDNYIFAVFDLIFYYSHQDWVNNARWWGIQQEQLYL